MKSYFLELRLSPFHFISTILIMTLLFCQCQSESSTSVDQTVHSNRNKSSAVQHATGFDLIPVEFGQILHIYSHFNESVDTSSILLLNRGESIPDQYRHLNLIEVPVEKIAVLHSSYVSFFAFAEAKSRIKAISEVKYVYDDEIYQEVQDGHIKEIGFGDALDKEQLLALNIDLVLDVGWPDSPNKNAQILNELGIPQIIFAEWQESTLLGRAEWVKIIASLTGKIELVSDKFHEIEAEYDSLSLLTQSISQAPDIICNLPYKGSWFVPGGNSYMSNLLKDAGGHYMWSHDTGIGGLKLGFESVYAEGIEADYWINPGIAHSLSDIQEKDSRLGDFNSLKSEQVYNSNRRIKRGEANDYWESGIVRPHVVLEDMIHILHPELLPDHELVYFKKIQ
jgi:iron complex transport system substrate-binding protein